MSIKMLLNLEKMKKKKPQCFMSILVYHHESSLVLIRLWNNHFLLMGKHCIEFMGGQQVMLRYTWWVARPRATRGTGKIIGGSWSSVHPVALYLGGNRRTDKKKLKSSSKEEKKKKKEKCQARTAVKSLIKTRKSDDDDEEGGANGDDKNNDDDDNWMKMMRMVMRWAEEGEYVMEEGAGSRH